MTELRQGRLVSSLFTLIGLGLLIATAISTIKTKTFITQSTATPGRVIDIAYDEHLEGSFTVFTFTDSNGQSHTNRTESAHNPSTHEIGASITVRYLKGQPQNARIDSFRTIWLLPAAFGGFGVAFTTIGLIALRSVRKTYG